MLAGLMFFMFYIATCITGLTGYYIKRRYDTHQKEIEMESLKMIEGNNGY